jgi:hypothetical protein
MLRTIHNPKMKLEPQFVTLDSNGPRIFTLRVWREMRDENEFWTKREIGGRLFGLLGGELYGGVATWNKVLAAIRECIPSIFTSEPLGIYTLELLGDSTVLIQCVDEATCDRLKDEFRRQETPDEKSLVIREAIYG